MDYTVIMILKKKTKLNLWCVAILGLPYISRDWTSCLYTIKTLGTCTTINMIPMHFI